MHRHESRKWHQTSDYATTHRTAMQPVVLPINYSTEQNACCTRCSEDENNDANITTESRGIHTEDFARPRTRLWCLAGMNTRVMDKWRTSATISVTPHFAPLQKCAHLSTMRFTLLCSYHTSMAVHNISAAVAVGRI